jgi:tetratricopeptide (TPR) repeat protein
MPILRRVANLIAFSLVFAMATTHAGDVQDINQLFRKGDLNEALNRTNQFLQKNPKDAQARFLKGLILADQNKSAEAIQIFTGLTEDYPELPEPYNNLAVLYAAQGKYDAARNSLEMAIRTHPSYATAHENLGDLYAKMASVAYDKALQLDTTNTSALTKLSLIKDLITGRRSPVPAKTTTVALADTTKPAKSATSTSAAQIPAAKPVSKPAPDVGPSPDDIIETVKAWAKAWSSNDVEAYLAFYAPDFKPASGSRSDWEAQRRERVGNGKGLTVNVSDIRIEPVSADRTSVRFHQQYRSARLTNSSTKKLELVRSGDKWLIAQESGR